MSVLFVALPAALAMAALAVAAFAVSVRGGQFDDLETPPVRMLFDDPPEAAAFKVSKDRNGRGTPTGPKPCSADREAGDLGG